MESEWLMRGVSRQVFLAVLLVMAVSPATAAPYRICIDPGHGGDDSGAVGCGLRESDVVLDVALRLRELIAADASLIPLMTRQDDVGVGLQARCDYANDSAADRFVSIHANAFDGTVSGIETYCARTASPLSFDQRDRIQDGMVTLWPDLPDRGGKVADFHVLVHTAMPASLSELAFVDYCATDAALLADPEERQRAAEVHHRALRASLGLGEQPFEPSEEGVLRGTVFEDQGVGVEDMSLRLTGALVRVRPSGADSGEWLDEASATGIDADWRFSLPAGEYVVQASRDGYEPNQRSCEVTAGDTRWCSLGLLLLPVISPEERDVAHGDIGESLGDIGAADPLDAIIHDEPSGARDRLPADAHAEGDSIVGRESASPGDYASADFVTDDKDPDPPDPPDPMDGVGDGCATGRSSSGGSGWALLLFSVLICLLLRATGGRATVGARVAGVALPAVLLLASGGCKAAGGDGDAERSFAGHPPRPLTLHSRLAPAGVKRFVSASEGAAWQITELARVTPDEGFVQPVWSPDDSHLAVARAGFGELYTLPPSGGDMRLVSRGVGVGREPVWRDAETLDLRAPGQRLSDIPALAVDLDGRRASPPVNPHPGLWLRVREDEVYERTRGVERRISPAGDRYCCARRSKDGRKVTFQGLSSGVFVYDRREGCMISLGPGQQARLSPCGERVAFARHHDDGRQITGAELSVAVLDGCVAVVHPLTGTPDIARNPGFAGDGERLAFDDMESIWVGRLAPAPVQVGH